MPGFLKSIVGSFTDPVFFTVIVAKVSTAPLGARTFEITLVPFFWVGRVTDKFLSLLTVSEAFFTGAVKAITFAFEFVVVKKLLALSVDSLTEALGEGPRVGEFIGRGDGERDGCSGVLSAGINVDGVGEAIGSGVSVLGGDGITEGAAAPPPPPPPNPPPNPPPPDELPPEVGATVISIGEVGCAEADGEAEASGDAFSEERIVTSSDATDVEPNVLTAVTAFT